MHLHYVNFSNVSLYIRKSEKLHACKLFASRRLAYLVNIIGSRKTVDWGTFSKPRSLHLENALHLAANMMVLRVNEAVESTSKQNIRGIYILTRSL
jgi:hypothetical protein